MPESGLAIGLERSAVPPDVKYRISLCVFNSGVTPVLGAGVEHNRDQKKARSESIELIRSLECLSDINPVHEDEFRLAATGETLASIDVGQNTKEFY